MVVMEVVVMWGDVRGNGGYGISDYGSGLGVLVLGVVIM